MEIPLRLPEAIKSKILIFLIVSAVPNRKEEWWMADNMKFEILADSIKSINIKAGNAAKSAVNYQILEKVRQCRTNL